MPRLRKDDTSFTFELDDAAYEVKPQTATERARIFEQIGKRFPSEGKGGRGKVPPEATAAYTAESLVATVLAWGPLKDSDGADRPKTGVRGPDDVALDCSPANKRLLAELNPEWADAVLKRAQWLDEERGAAEAGN